MTTNPIAVLISDIHFNITTLPLAHESLLCAILKAESLKVPLVIAGDLNDTKAIIRAEVANSLIDLIGNSKAKVHILVGNHDLINEKGSDNGLNYLAPYAHIVSRPFHLNPQTLLIPYQNNLEDLRKILSYYKNPHLKTLIMHQGFQGASMGDYVQDKTSIEPDAVKEYKVISGHYHRHQTIGTVTYIGSPYTITFGEANDGPKGFLVLNEDGSFTREILNLRAHKIFQRTLEEIHIMAQHGPEEAFYGTLSPDDLVWLKVTGPYSELQKLDKKAIGERLFGHSNYRLDLIPTEMEINKNILPQLTDHELLDCLIDDLPESDKQKIYLKRLWRDLCD